jgi:hypothetical protein
LLAKTAPKSARSSSKADPLVGGQRIRVGPRLCENSNARRVCETFAAVIAFGSGVVWAALAGIVVANLAAQELAVVRSCIGENAEALAVVASENYIRAYRWCSPPRI